MAHVALAAQVTGDGTSSAGAAALLAMLLALVGALATATGALGVTLATTDGAGGDPRPHARPNIRSAETNDPRRMWRA